MNDCSIIILGATGDLAKRKLLPDLYRLVQKNFLQKFVLIGAAFDDVSADVMLEHSKEFVKKFDESSWQQLRDKTYYQKLDFNNLDDFKKLAALVAQVEKEHNLSGNRLVYCAAASHFFCAITEHLATSGLAQKRTEQDKTWHRIVYEKPFGHDVQSAHEINECIAANFEENQIYRIDHYLTKELVSNIALIRFTNCVLEPLWNNRYIDNVQIVLSEQVGIENRGAYYDKYGALSDVLQNHMLELVALIGMESPEKLTGEYIRELRSFWFLFYTTPLAADQRG